MAFPTKKSPLPAPPDDATGLDNPDEEAGEPSQLDDLEQRVSALEDAVFGSKPQPGAGAGAPPPPMGGGGGGGFYGD